MTYIPYSQRNGIKDPDLAGLLDHCERNIECDILHISDIRFEIIMGGYARISICLLDDGATNGYTTGNFNFLAIPTKLFFRTYKTLLPCIRGLYSK